MVIIGYLHMDGREALLETCVAGNTLSSDDVDAGPISCLLRSNKAIHYIMPLLVKV